MDTADNTTGAPLDTDAAVRAVIEQALSDTPTDPEAARAVHGQAARITEAINALFGEGRREGGRGESAVC